MLMGVLAGQPFSTMLIGDASLSRRPMARVADPLREMGAKFQLCEEKFAPVEITGTKLRGISHCLKVASAQVKSALLLAALYAEGETSLTGEIHSRDHTERLLPHFGVELSITPSKIEISSGQRLKAADFRIPGDPSSAAFWIAGACLIPGANVRVQNLLMNPTRTGFLRALQRMGADLQLQIDSSGPEPVGEAIARGSRLQGISITPREIPDLVDELPMLAVLGAFAHGTTEVHGAEELRVKETDRIEAVASNLRQMGAELETFEDGFRIQGPQKLRGAELDSFGDHRIAMAFSIGALAATGNTRIRNSDSVTISYPEFFNTLRKLSHA
jgi:3-phosphoshikimate 1-carboxyvinyltransferase